MKLDSPGYLILFATVPAIVVSALAMLLELPGMYRWYRSDLYRKYRGKR